MPDHISGRLILGWIGIAAIGAGVLQAARPAEPAAAPAPSLVSPEPQAPRPEPAHTSLDRALLDRYCVTCHNARLKTGGLALDTIDVAQVGSQAEVWEKVARKLRTRAMPPVGRPRPDEATYTTFVASLETALDRAAATKPNPGRPAIHRLNRAEYTNAIRDLLAVEFDGQALLPPDNVSYGFDNIAASLTVSPALWERYMSAAGKISRLAVGDSTARSSIENYSINKLYVQDERMSQDLPFGSRGGLAIRHHFPLDGEYVIRVRLRRHFQECIRGMGKPHLLEVRLDGAVVKQFTVGGKAPRAPALGDIMNGCAFQVTVDPEWAEWDRYMRTADAGLEVRVPVKSGTRVVGVSFPEQILEPEEIPQPPLVGWSLAVSLMVDGNPGLDQVQIEGPFSPQGLGETASRRKIFVCRPKDSQDETRCAKTILGTLARRAYRRAVTDDDLRPLLSFYETGSREGGFEGGIEEALRSLLVDPEFLFRIERDPANVTPATAFRISDIELASRLSFFLWSSIPDDALLDLAVRGKLKEPAVVEQQVRRMLADPRSTALVTNFASQWLELRKMRGVIPDPSVFPAFEENLRDAFQKETELFVDSILREDRSVLDLLRANYTFVNERLARHYQIPNVYGERFRKVTLNGQERGGLLGHASILTVTSYGNRTSPVLRGKWVLENLLGAPPPPPPANVPALPELGEAGKVQSVRERMEQHRKNPVCATCHAQMDPLGFALEPFDAIGTWRTRDKDVGTPIDASGALPDGTKFEGPMELRKLLVNSRGDEFVSTVTEKLLTYALGRGVEFYDAPVIRQITREAAASEYRWSAIVLGIVKSMPFQMRRSES